MVQLSSLFILLVVTTAAGAAAGIPSAGSQALPGCESRCGDVEIPYPFGFGDDRCSMEGLRLVCDDKNYNPPKPFSGNTEVLAINLTMGQLRVNASIERKCYDAAGKLLTPGLFTYTLREAYTFSAERDRFFVTGCDSLVYLNDPVQKLFATGCVSYCSGQSSIPNDTCSGIGCCQTEIPKDLRYYQAELQSFYNHTRVHSFNPCTLAFVADIEGFDFNMSYISTDFTYQQPKLPVVMEWSVVNYTCQNARTSQGHTYACRSNNSECFNSKNGRGYICNCSAGYDGNPYLPGGCQDMNECENQEVCPRGGVCVNTPGSYDCTCKPGFHAAANPKTEGCIADSLISRSTIPSFLKWAIGCVLGVVFLILVVFGACFGYKHIKLIHLRQKFFEQNGGIFLKRQMVSDRATAFNIFTLAQLEKASENFSEERLLGEGGNGSVYRGKLKDGREVAIKREKKQQDSKSAMKKTIAENESKKKEFAGEMLILAGINHKNVVKLLGCCLEVEIPMLVYEYITNKTLSYYIHSGVAISFSECLRIATEAARALAYLHDEIEPAIIHGDIKPSNILLDDKYRVKVADFGTSIYADKYADGQTSTMHVKGTLGYLDPEYMQTGQLTDKSDVHSFGVVLMEFLCRSKDFGSIMSRFISSANSERIAGVVHPCYLDRGRPTEQLVEVAKLAVKCMQPTGNVRPSMVELALALETIGRSVERSGPALQQEELVSLELFRDPGYIGSTSSFSIESMEAPTLDSKYRGR